MYNPNTTGDAELVHYPIPLPKAKVHTSHPFTHKANHEKLLQYLRGRLTRAKRVRDSEIPRLTRIDKDIAGWMKLSDEDRKRLEQHERDGNPQPTNMNLPLSFVHIDDMMTYFAQTFAPNRGMFYHTGKPGETQEASQIVTLMNNHAIYSGFYRQVLLGIYSMLKYNRGGYKVLWSRDTGPRIDTARNTVTTELRWQGNKMESIDLYNFLPDPSVHPTELHKDGEYAAEARLRSYYWLQNRASQGGYYNCEEAFAGFTGSSECKYYRHPPTEAQFDSNESNGTNWVAILAETPEYASDNSFELVDITIRLDPTQFGLVENNQRTTRKGYEIWQFTILNDTWIIAANHQNNMHNYLPYFMGLINDDVMGTSQKGVAEILQPLQDFASFLLNVHMHGSRSSLWGLTVYDPTVVDLSAVPKGEVAGTIPVKPAGYGKNVNEAIWKYNSTLDTKQTLSDLDALMGIINQFFPTQSLPSQIASIDRAVDSQVAAVQQGANRRQQKAARLLDDSCFRNVRFAMYYNIIQYQPDQEDVTDFYTGKPIKINLASMRNTDLPFIIGQGLKSLDRQAAASLIQQVIFAMIQAPAVAQQVDLMGLIDYWTSMLDIDVDMTQFRVQPPAPAEAPQQVDAAGNPIQPATNPGAVTAPIYG